MSINITGAAGVNGANGVAHDEAGGNGGDGQDVVAAINPTDTPGYGDVETIVATGGAAGDGGTGGVGGDGGNGGTGGDASGWIDGLVAYDDDIERQVTARG